MHRASVVDENTLAGIAANDPKACELFVLLLRPKLERLARLRGSSQEDAEEIVQDTLVAALGQLRDGRFDRRSQVTSWVQAILERRAVDHYRRLRRHTHRAQSLDHMGTLEANRLLAAPAPPHAHREALLVRHALSCLSPQQRLVLVWNAGYGLPAREIAPRLRLGVKTTEALLTAARKAFRSAVSQAPPPSDSRGRSTPKSNSLPWPPACTMDIPPA